jgi:magnesium-transporting ATPase (P-type)
MSSRSISINMPINFIEGIKNSKIENKKNQIINLKKELAAAIENFGSRPNAYMCFTGKAFEYFLRYYKEEKILLKEKEELLKDKNANLEKFSDYDNVFHKLGEILIERCKVFSRMQPTNKVDLVNFLKENKDNIVGMCGDGANDCGALLSADTGISISQNNKNNVTAHFYSENDSIECIEIILRSGRACFENSVIIFKFMILYGITQNCSVLLFFSIASSDFSFHQYLYIDCFVVLITCILASKYLNH